MNRRILLDANLLIAALDTKNEEAITQLTALLSNENTALAISPLIRYEVMRGVNFSDTEKYDELNYHLNQFEEFNIDYDIAILSSHLFRLARSKKEDRESSIVDKRSFDVFHLATAKCNELELCSNDNRDFKRLEKLYQSWQDF